MTNGEVALYQFGPNSSPEGPNERGSGRARVKAQGTPRQVSHQVSPRCSITSHVIPHLRRTPLSPSVTIRTCGHRASRASTPHAPRGGRSLR